jgi:hypothetical protein
MRSSAFWLLALTASLGFAQESADAKLSPADKALPLIFDEDLSDATRLFREFKSVRSGEQGMEIGKSWTWKAGVSLVRPVRVGTQAEIAINWQFPELPKDGDASESRLGFVFADKQIGWVAFVRQREKGTTKAELRVLREVGDPKSKQTLVRTLPAEADFAAGPWSLKVRCGAATVWHKDKRIGAGHFETRFAPIMGIVLAQETGQVTVKRLTLRGTEFPKPLSPEKAEMLAMASGLNEEGKAFYLEKKYDEAAEKTQAALELYKKVHADTHNDVANSLHNVAIVLRDGGRKVEAVSFYEQAIKLRQKLFGEDHPDTGRLEMELGALLAQQGKLSEAFPHCLRAYLSFSAYHGPDHPLSVTTHKLLDKLPPPEP